MLEELDAINWSALAHADGAATDVPVALRGLVSEDTWVRYDSFEWLMRMVWNHGAVPSAAPAVLACLFELIEEEAVPTRGRCLSLAHWLVRAAHDDPSEFARDTFATLHAAVPSLVDTYHGQTLRPCEQNMLLLILSYCRAQADYVLEEIGTESMETQLLESALVHAHEFARNLLYTMAEGCEDDAILDDEVEVGCAVQLA